MRSLVLFATSLALLHNTLYAQGNGSQNRGRGQHSLYNPATIVRVEGTIVDIQSVTRQGPGAGIHIRLQTTDNVKEIHLGPSWYIEKQDVKLNIKDNVTVTGSEVTYNGAKVIIAAKVEKGPKTLELRDANGIPKWAQNRRQ